MIVEKILESKARGGLHAWPNHTNRASELGHDCVRYLVLSRTQWQEKAPIDVGLKMIFDLGNDIERIVLREMAEAGLTVVEQQRTYEWPEYQITGHCDGLLRTEGEAEVNTFPFDIKSASPYMFDAINSVADMRSSRYVYLRKYPAQLNLYLLMANLPKGFFLFKNKVTGAYKEIWMDLDYTLGEHTLRKAEAINAHVAAGTLPDAPGYDEAMCGRCGFQHICLPEVSRAEMTVVDDAELAAMLDRQEALKPAYSEYNAIGKSISKALEGVEKAVCGDWIITGKEVERKGYTVEPTVYWKRTVRRV